MALLDGTFTARALAPDFNPQTMQELFDEFARLLSGSITIPGGTYVDGGTEPASDEGPWLPPGGRELWFWDAAFSKYYPGGPPAGSILINTQSDGFPTPNWIRCDGSAQPQATYPRLFSAIGHLWASDVTDATALQAAGNFRLPPSDGRVILGAGAPAENTLDQTLSITGRAIGTKGGKERFNLVTANMPDFVTREYDATPSANSLAQLYGGTSYDSVVAAGVASPRGGTGVVQAVETMPPWVCMNIYVRF